MKKAKMNKYQMHFYSYKTSSLAICIINKKINKKDQIKKKKKKGMKNLKEMMILMKKKTLMMKIMIKEKHLKKGMIKK